MMGGGSVSALVRKAAELLGAIVIIPGTRRHKAIEPNFLVVTMFPQA